MEYFSDLERGHKSRTEEEVSPTTWGGIVAFIQSLISTGALGYQFPESCPDPGVFAPIGTDQEAFSLALKAEITGIDWPLQTQTTDLGGSSSWESKPFSPDTLLVLDLVQFCYKNSAKPIHGSFHKYYHHHHLTYDVAAGQKEFRERINMLFSRNGLAYELDINGAIVRLAPPILRETLMNAVFQTGDKTLDHMLEESRCKFLNPDTSIRREAIERLWDAWERIKTIENPDNKKLSIGILLKKVTDITEIRQMLDDEAKKITEIGNSFQIRHSEVTQTMISDSDHLDYLFHRLFSLMQLLLKKL